MNHIKQFNRTLNMSDSNRNQKWQEYRNLVSGYISDYIIKHDISANKLLIIGVGNSDDLDLSVLSKLFRHTTISDIDIESMRSAVARYNLDRHNLILKEIDYTGLESDSYWNDFINQILQCQYANEIKTFLDHLINQIRLNSFIADFKTKYDSIIVSPIYTQLLFRQMKEYVSFLRNQKYPEHLTRFLDNQILGMIPDIIDSFNINVISLLNEGGYLFVLSDIFEAKPDSLFYTKAKIAVESKIGMDEIYEDYLSDFGVGIGDYGLLSLEKKLSTLQHEWFLWPFNQEKHYFVKLEIYK